MIKINGTTAEDVGLGVGMFSLRKRARQNYETLSVPGKATPNITLLGTYSPVSISIPADLLDYSRIDEVYAWLGSGKATLIDERDPEKYRVGYCLEEVTVDCYNEDICNLSIPFVCEPFLYLVDEYPESLTMVATGGYATITTPGINTEPRFHIKITAGSSLGLLELTVNGAIFSVDFPDIVNEEGLEVVIDSANNLTYYIDSSGYSHVIGSATSGVYPTFRGGSAENTVSLFANATSALVYVNTRYL